MEIRVGGRPLTVTMRTPGDDFDLAVGFLVSEGVVHGAEDVAAIRYCAGATADGGNTYNVVDVSLAPGVAAPDASLERNFYTTSSCGLCGKASLDAVRTTAAWSVAEDPLSIGTDVLTALPDRLRAAQRGSTAPAVCTPRGSSRPMASRCVCGRTSGGTTPWTRSSATPCGRGSFRCAGRS